ncbi:MAG: ubiquitin-like domain-containing protein [Candidatus Methanomethylophilaceae archaeon]|jgi:hypothetical protein
MGIRLKVKNAEMGKELTLELSPDETIEDVINSAAEFWNKDSGAYIIRRGKQILKGGMKISDLGILNDDVVELIPDPEGG